MKLTCLYDRHVNKEKLSSIIFSVREELTSIPDPVRVVEASIEYSYQNTNAWPNISTLSEKAKIKVDHLAFPRAF